MGRDRNRKRVECPDSYTLNLDILGPVNRGEDQDGTGFYYALVGAFTVPCVGNNPIAQGLQELGHDGAPDIRVDEEERQKPWTSKDIEQEVYELEQQHGCHRQEAMKPREKQENAGPGEIVAQSHGQEQPHDHGQGECHDHPLPGLHEVLEEDPVEHLFDAVGKDPEDWTEMEVQAWDVMNRKWQDKVAGLKSVKVTTLTFAVPMRSRHSQEVIRALSLMYGKLRSLNVQLVRIHSDRARELLAKPVQQWIQSRNIMQTVAAGDEPQGSARVEWEIQYLKQTIRLLLSTSKAPVGWWPLALRQATEMRHRSQLQLRDNKLLEKFKL